MRYSVALMSCVQKVGELASSSESQQSFRPSTQPRGANGRKEHGSVADKFDLCGDALRKPEFLRGALYGVCEYKGRFFLPEA